MNDQASKATKRAFYFLSSGGKRATRPSKKRRLKATLPASRNKTKTGNMYMYGKVR